MSYQKIPVNVKFTLLGLTKCGKTALANKFVKNEFLECESTIGANFYTKEMKWNGSKYWAQIWDTAGAKTNKDFLSMYYKGSHVILVAFDLTNKESFNNAQQQIKELEQNEQLNNSSIILVGTKADDEINRVVTQEDIEKFDANNKYNYMATSAKNGKGVNEVFEKGIELYRQKNPILESDDINTHEHNTQPTRSPSSSLSLRLCIGVLASSLGAAALVIGALAVALVLTVIAPPIGIALIATGAVALATGVGFFASAGLKHKKDKKQQFESLFEDDLVYFNK